jgi:Family of unknown function (DUF6328)
MGALTERHPETGRDETEEERLDRNLQEFLGELRVALPGVQVLFAFLLVVPFNQRFPSITEFQKTTYFVTLMLTAAASICLIAPTVQHRIEFRAQDKERILMTSNRLAILGLAFLALAMTGAIMLITDMLYGSTLTIVASAAVGIAFGVLWYVVPLRRLRQQ